MGSSPSKNVESGPDNRAYRAGEGKNNVGDVRDDANKPHKINDDAKRAGSREGNKRKSVTYKGLDGPMIAVQNSGSEYIEVDDKSANAMMKDAKIKQKQSEDDITEAESMRRAEKARRTARIESLKKQLNQRANEMIQKHDTVELNFDTIQNAEIDIGHIQISHNYSTLVHPIDKREDLYQRYVKVKTRKAHLILRLSELAAARLKHNNPNIADISDENRASRLFAKFSELYDNEYTDLFEVYSAKLPETLDEEVPISHLRDGLKFCYTTCKEAAAEQRKRLAFILHMNNNVHLDETTVGLQLRIKEFQKNVAKFTITNLQSNIHQGITKEESVKTLIEKTKTSSTGSNPYLRLYLDRCTELCWYTQIQDPPVALDFSNRQNIADYRSYTRSGDYIQYIVWPVLLIHENGPVLFKGIAHFYGRDSTDTHGEKNVHSHSTKKKRTNATKRESLPYSHVPGDDTADFTKTARAAIIETGQSNWD